MGLTTNKLGNLVAVQSYLTSMVEKNEEAIASLRTRSIASGDGVFNTVANALDAQSLFMTNLVVALHLNEVVDLKAAKDEKETMQ